MTTTKAQVQAAVGQVLAIAEAIRDLKRVPNGEFYVQVMNYLSLEEYNAIIALLKKHGVVKEENHVLTYIGPEKAA